MHNAALGGNRALVELLATRGDVNGQTPLCLSVHRGRRDIVELLIAKGADVNAKNKWGLSALDIAVILGHTEIVELLHKHGARE